MRLSPIGRATVVTSRAEQYRQLARDCHSLARSLSPGRAALQCKRWLSNGTAWQTSRSAPLICGRRVLMSDDFSVPDRRDGCPAAYASLCLAGNFLPIRRFKRAKTSCFSLLWENGLASAGLLFAGALGCIWPSDGFSCRIPTLAGTHAPVLASYVYGTQVRLQQDRRRVPTARKGVSGDGAHRLTRKRAERAAGHGGPMGAYC